MTNSGTLTLVTPGSINLAGAVNATGGTTLEANGAITATAPANNFGGSLDLEGVPSSVVTNAQSADVVSAVALTLKNVDITDNLTVSAGGALTSTGAIMVGGNVNFSTTSGDISFGDSGNTIGGTLSASVSTSGSDNNTLEDNLPNGGLTIGTITLGTGTLELDDFYSAFASVTSPAVSEGRRAASPPLPAASASMSKRPTRTSS